MGGVQTLLNYAVLLVRTNSICIADSRVILSDDVIGIAHCNLLCHFPTADVITCSCSTSNVITAVVSCAVSFIIAALVGAVVHYCTVKKKCDCQKFYSLTIAHKQQQQQPAPVYDDIVGQSQNIELKENVAYGPMQQ